MIKKEFTYSLRKAILSILIGELILLFLVIVCFFYFNNSQVQSSDRIIFRYPNLLFLHLLCLPIQFMYILNLRNVNQLIGRVRKENRDVVLNTISFKKSLKKYFYSRFVLFFIVFALAQPFYGVQKVKAKVNSLELVVALDISNSMNTKDIDKVTTRLEIAKRALNQLVNSFTGEKIGVVIFAGSSYVQLPLTSDYSAAKMFIDEVNTSMISNQGTNIANALQTSMDMFSKDHTKKSILLVTDGENHEVNPDAIYQALNEKKIELSVVGIGTIKGGLIPNNPKRPELGYKTDNQGKPIISKLNKVFIQSIANQINGLAMICSNTYPNFKELIQSIKQKSESEFNENEFKVEKSKYQIPLFLAFLFWILYLIEYSNFSFSLLNQFKK